jgi:hypothetical protein
LLIIRPAEIRAMRVDFHHIAVEHLDRFPDIHRHVPVALSIGPERNGGAGTSILGGVDLTRTSPLPVGGGAPWLSRVIGSTAARLCS